MSNISDIIYTIINNPASISFWDDLLGETTIPNFLINNKNLTNIENKYKIFFIVTFLLNNEGIQNIEQWKKELNRNILEGEQIDHN